MAGDSTDKTAADPKKEIPTVTPAATSTPVASPPPSVRAYEGDSGAALRESVVTLESPFEQSSESPAGILGFDPDEGYSAKKKPAAKPDEIAFFESIFGSADDTAADGNDVKKEEKAKEQDKPVVDSKATSPPEQATQVQLKNGDFGFIAGRTSDGKVLVQIAGREDQSTANQDGHNSTWYKEHGFEQIKVGLRDGEGKIIGQAAMYYHRGDPESILDEAELVSVEDNATRRPDNFVMLDADNVKELPQGERRTLVRENNLEITIRNEPVKLTDMSYRHYADGVTIGIPNTVARVDGFNPQRDIRLYSPDGGITKIPLFRSKEWFQLAANSGVSEGDVKFHIVSNSAEDARALDKVVLPLLHEALGPNPQSPEAKALHELIVSAKMQDVLNRDPAFANQSVDSALKLYTDRKTGRPVRADDKGGEDVVYRNLQTGPRGQEAKHYTVYSRNAEDARKAAEIVDQYIAKQAKQQPSLVLPEGTATGSVSDGRRLPGTNRIALVRETWPFATIMDSKFEDAQFLDVKSSSPTADRTAEREAIGASVEQELGSQIREYAQKKYGQDGPLSQTDLDRICKDAGIKPGFLTHDSKGKLAVHASLWLTGRGEAGDMAYMADGDSDTMKRTTASKESSTEKTAGLTGRHAIYALYELVNEQSPQDRDPLHHVEKQEEGTKRYFVENRPASMSNDADFTHLQSLRNAMLSGNVSDMKTAIESVSKLESRSADRIMSEFRKDLSKHKIDSKLSRSSTSKDLELTLHYEGNTQGGVTFSSDPSKPTKWFFRDWQNKSTDESVEPDVVQKSMSKYSEAVRYRVKYSGNQISAPESKPKTNPLIADQGEGVPNYQDLPRSGDQPKASPLNEAQQKALDAAKQALAKEAPNLNLGVQNDRTLKAILEEVTLQLGHAERQQLTELLKNFKGDEIRTYLSPDTAAAAKPAEPEKQSPGVGLRSGDEGLSTSAEALRRQIADVKEFDEVKAIELRSSKKVLETLKAEGMDEKKAEEIERKLTSKDPHERASAMLDIDRYFDKRIAKTEAQATQQSTEKEGEKERVAEKGKLGRGWESFTEKFGNNKGKIGTLIVVLGPLVPLVLNKQIVGDGEFGGATFSK